MKCGARTKNVHLPHSYISGFGAQWAEVEIILVGADDATAVCIWARLPAAHADVL